MKYILFILLSAKLISCNNKVQTNNHSGASKTTNDEKTTSSNIDQKPVADNSGCYMKIIGRDTAIIVLEQKGNDLTGKKR